SYASRTSPMPPRPSTFSTRNRPSSTLPGRPRAGAGCTSSGGGTFPPVNPSAQQHDSLHTRSQYTLRASYTFPQRFLIPGGRAGLRPPLVEGDPLPGPMRRVMPARWRSALRTSAATRAEPASETVRDARARIRVASLLGLGGYTLFLALELSGVQGDAARER